MATVLNLADIQRAKAKKGDMAGAGVVSLIIQECDIANLLPWRTLGTLSVKDRTTNSIPTVGFRQGRGTSFGTISGIGQGQAVDEVFQMGAQIDIEKIDTRDSEAPDLLGERTKLAVKGMSWTFNDYFINGDQASDPHDFDGIKVRLANMASAQIVYGNSGSAELDVRAAAGPSEATMYTFLDKIDEAIDALDGHNGDIALTSSDFIATLRSVLRRLGKYTEKTLDLPNYTGNVGRRTSSDKPSKPVLIYPEDKGIKWYDMGFKADQSTRVIGTDTVNSQACRPVYFLKLGHPYIEGIQMYPIEVGEPKLTDDQLSFRVTVDWPVGLHHVHNKGISKLAGVRVA